MSLDKKRSYRDKQEVRPTAEKVGLQKMARTLSRFHECSTIKTSVTLNQRFVIKKKIKIKHLNKAFEFLKLQNVNTTYC